MKIKKLLIALLSITMVFCFMLAFPVVAESGDTSETTESKTISPVNAENAYYEISVTSPGHSNPVLIGSDKTYALSAGETVEMQFTLVSGSWSGTMNGLYIGRSDKICTEYPSNSTGVVGWMSNGADGYIAHNGKTDSGLYSEEGNPDASAATIFVAGNQIKITYTPWVDEANPGVAQVLYRKADSNADWTCGLKIYTSKYCENDYGIWLLLQTTKTIVIKDYSITTTFGANLLGVGDNRTESAQKGTYVYGVGMAYVYQNCEFSITPESYAYTVTDEITNQSYFGPGVAAVIDDGETLVQEYDIESVDGLTGTFGFYLSFWFVPGNPGGENTARGIWLSCKSDDEEVASASGFMESDTVFNKTIKPHDIFKTGNSIRIEYKPYESEENPGSFDVYYKTATATEYTLAIDTTIGEAAKKYWEEDDGTKTGAYIRLMWKDCTPTFTLSSYREYLINNQTKETETVFETRYKNATFRPTGGTTYICYVNGELMTSDVYLNENKLTFSGATVLNTNVYVKSGDSYKLPTATVAEGYEFNGWTANGTTYAAGDVVTVDADTEFVADVTAKSAITYTVLGEDSTVYVANGDYTLKTVELTDTTFIGWENEGKLYNAGDVVTVNGNMTFTAVTVADFANNGAAISVKDFMGIRFETTFNTEDMAAASAYVVEYGTLIARVGDIGDKDALTTSNSTAIKKIKSTMILSDIDGLTTYTGGVSNLQTHNYGVEIAGCGYMVIEYADGETATIYTDVLVRTAKGIAEYFISEGLYEEGTFEYSVLTAYVTGAAFPTEE